ncbi:MAG: PorP/SprF family type IX secretion system membrane protein [Bacteroidales bacterium]|jgi:type IX secretion system PorP/SprF family membrane protein
MSLHQQKFEHLNVAIIAIVCLILSQLNGFTQDMHFSQLHPVPVCINAGNTGIFDGDLRICSAYRNQWSKIDFPYHTYFLSADGSTRLFGRQFGIGGYFLHDQSSSVYLTADKFFLSLSHTSFFKNNQIVVGIQPGLVLKQFDSDRITFGAQFDPDAEVFDPDLYSNEGFLENRMRYFDLNAGVLWRLRLQNLFLTTGFSATHINRPVESFFDDNDSTRLPVKYSVHGNLNIPVLKKFELVPIVLYSFTTGAEEFVGGVTAAYFPANADLVIQKIYVISSFRIDPVKTIDAMVIGGGARIANIELAITYDINISSLRKASNYQGAFELSLIYTLNTSKSGKLTEPCILL